MLEKNNGNCSIRFDVSDNGIGISKEALDRLWQVFEQADNSINREHGGMGLGLPLAKRIVNLMQGELMIKSELGKGSCFTCYVQLGVAREAEAVDVTNEANTASGDSLLTSDLGEKRILIVDDVSINRDILFALLEDTGMILDGACNGEEAVSMFQKNKYDLVLMDLHMPVMDGYTATKKIRASAQPWAKSVPIISISADTGAERISKCLEAGMNEHLPKPVEVEALFGTISKWMPKTGAERKTAA
jgi:CheY-like chemotaxis protein